ncbi:MAG: hypothetical protein AAF999_07755 [Pseudomonadota bacterium]
MEPTGFHQALTSDALAMARNVLWVVHFVGLAVGVGAATILDLVILRLFMVGRITRQNCDLMRVCSRIVIVGLGLLWCSGMGLLALHAIADPDKLTNDRVWAKMAIVLILTINALLVHTRILPFLIHQTGKTPLQDLSLIRRHVYLTSGVVSVVSWNAPVVIANLTHLSFEVPMLQILQVYVMVLVGMLTLSHMTFAARSPRTKARSKPNLYEPRVVAPLFPRARD